MTASKIYIFDDHAEIAESTKCLVESRRYAAVLLKDYNIDFTLPKIMHQDTVVINLLDDSPFGFRLLNALISAPERPNIVLTTQFGSELQPSDYFPGNRVRVLVHPVEPNDLLDAVRPH